MKKLMFVGIMAFALFISSCSPFSPKSYDLEIRNNTNSIFSNIKLYTHGSDVRVSYPDVAGNSVRTEEMRYKDVESFEATYKLSGTLESVEINIDIILPYSIDTLKKDSYPTKFIIEIPEGTTTGEDLTVTPVYEKD